MSQRYVVIEEGFHLFLATIDKELITIIALGDRVFAWKVYTPQAETAQPLFDGTMSRFTCGQ